MRKITIVLVTLFCFVLGFIIVQPAKANDDEAIHHVLKELKSPLPGYTISAFKKNNPDFDIAGYLAVVGAESSYGRDMYAQRHFNVGSIKGGSVGKIWRDLRIGTTPAGYNVYRNFYDGQRAAIRLIYDAGYNKQLRNHDWEGFANRYYGKDVPGKDQYIKNLKIHHDRIVKMAREKGAKW
jgi:hypothetical protein